MKDLITIAPPDPELPRELIDSPGGFVWWYADMLDASKSGLVLIWSFGLPFLPGYTERHRRGESQLPRERPSLNVAVYDRGELACYLLQEFEPGDADWTGTTWQFGRSTLESTLDGASRVLNVTLDCSIPGSEERLQGTVRLAGPARRAVPGEKLGGSHDWTPLTGPAKAEWRLRAGEFRYEGSGRGYHDCNGGRSSLEDAGIHEWTWGRLPFEAEERIYYIAWPEPGARPEALGVTIDERGGTECVPLDTRISRWRRTPAGMRFPDELVLSAGETEWLRVRTADLVDHGPFYLRYFVDGEAGGERTTGIGEICRPGRIDLGRHRPLVRMRVHHLGGKNSFWLPLFSGPRTGRLRRLIGQLGGSS